MRPVRLEFSGLRSYRQRTVIDFVDLDLFAIIGDTGAGKSTVIEALSLALYGRKTWTGGSNLEELIADGENTMAIELVFAAEGYDWTVTRSRHRNSSAPVNKLECSALGEKVDGNKAVNERIEQLLGLDHSQFVRAVVLPQGRFDELLQATRTERNKILRSIFGLDDLRRVRDDATRRRDRWRPVIEAAVARREALDPNPAQALAAARSSANALQQRVVTLSTAAAFVDTRVARGEQLDRHITAVRAANAHLAVDAHFDDDSFADELKALVDKAAALVAERADLEARQSQLATLRQEAAEQQTALLEGFADQASAVRAAANLRSVSATLAELDTDHDALQREIERLVAATPVTEEPAEILTALHDARARTEAAVADLDEVTARVAAAAALWQHYVAASAELAVARTTDAEASESATAAANADARAQSVLETAAASVLEARSVHDRAIQNNAAVVAAHELEPGHECPVCSQIVPEGFAAPVAADIERSADVLERAERALLVAQREATAAETTARHDATAATSAKTALEDALIRMGERRAAVSAAGLDPGDAAGVDADDTVALAALRAMQSEAEAAVADARVLLDAAERARANAAAERNAASAAHERELAAARVVAERVADRRSAQRAPLRSLPAAWAPADDATPDDLVAVADRIDHMVSAVAARAAETAEAGREEAAANQRFAELKSDAIENVTTPMASILRAVNHCIAGARALTESDQVIGEPDASASELPDMPAVPDALPDSILLDDVGALAPQIRQRIDALTPMAEFARRLLTKLERERSDCTRAVAEALSAAGVADPAALHGAAGAARAEAIQSERDVVRLEDQLEQAERLDAMLVSGRPYLANLEVLIQSLRDQHFVDHLVSAREVELLAEATRRLTSISGGRYGFVPDFGVVRIASGEVRSPDTLSGGERFQAALALALALVEIASRGAGKLDAVFVDEGFGSLDGAALDVALDTLGSVAGGGKLVALISHLHPVAEYVDTVFSVTKDDLFGSSIAKLDAEAREALLDDDIRSGLTS